MATREPILGADGLLARDSGPWAREKLNHLQRYMEMVTTSMPGKWKGLVFIDLMAGPGLCVDRTDNSEFVGSPLISLRTKKPWSKVYLVELDEATRTALQQRVAAQPRAATAEVIVGDSNAPSVIARLRTAADGVLSLAFVDLIGQEVAFDTIRALTAARHIDLWFSFPEMDLRRNATIAPGDAEEAVRWTRFFGTDAWRPIVSSRRPGPALIQLRELYLKQLASLGYLTEFSRLPMKNSLKRSMYRPLFASRDSRGIDFFRKAIQKSGISHPATLFDLR
jgi:three-Cys-motif partner protein